MLYILKGILNLARQLKDADMLRRGSKFYGLILIMGTLGILLSIAAAVLPKGSDTSAAFMILTILVLALTILEYVLLLLYFGRAVKMLKGEGQ